MRRESCLCGGLITASKGKEEITVRLHNTSLLHRVWRLSREGHTAYRELCDLSERAERASAPSMRAAKRAKRA